MLVRVQKAGVTGISLHKASHEPGGEDALTDLTDASFAAANKDGDAAVPSLRTLGTGAQQALPGNHASTTNARTPTAHKTSHEPGGGDALTGLTDASFHADNIDGATSEPSLRTLGSAAQQAAPGDHLHDSRYVRTVNGTGPDGSGNVVVSGGEGGTAGVGSIEGVSPNSPGGNINLTSDDASVTIAADDGADEIDLSVPGVATNASNLTTHAALAVDPTSTDTSRTKHISNSDLNKLRDAYLPPHHFKGTLAATTGAGRVPIMRAGTITRIDAVVNTAPTGAGVALSIRKNGSEVATLTIAAGSTSQSSTGLSLAVASGDYLTVNIVSVGSTVAGADLTVSYLSRLI